MIIIAAFLCIMTSLLSVGFDLGLLFVWDLHVVAQGKYLLHIGFLGVLHIGTGGGYT